MEVLVQPGLLAHPAPRLAMVIGGGEGATVREILRHRGITDCLMVDIDDEVVKECREHLAAMHRGAFDDAHPPPARGRPGVSPAHQRSLRPHRGGPGGAARGRPGLSALHPRVLRLVRDRLTEGGVMTMQAGMTKVNELAFYAAVHRTLREVFPVVAPYQAFISCYGTPWGFMLASKGVDPRRQTAEEIDRLIASRMSPGELGGRVSGFAGTTAAAAPAEPSTTS